MFLFGMELLTGQNLSECLAQTGKKLGQGLNTPDKKEKDGSPQILSSFPKINFPRQFKGYISANEKNEKFAEG